MKYVVVMTNDEGSTNAFGPFEFEHDAAMFIDGFDYEEVEIYPLCAP